MHDKLTEAIANCEHEPIHALGSIQSHGALLCFDRQGALLAKSRTAEDWLGRLPAVGETFDDRHFDAVARQALRDALAMPTMLRDGAVSQGVGQESFDLVIHWSGDTLIAEWEQIPPDAFATGHYAMLAQRAIQRLQEQDHDRIEPLLQAAVEAVRSMTGFDRVMGYRFLQDDSGEVIAEARREDLSPFLHQRYPAADIPAQARRLYVLHPIRQIVSVNEVPVPIEPALRPDTGQPYDLSHAHLRSVSPIHIEYLKNMGVAASMSISIVIDGKLWGLIACHHMRPYRASLAVRLSCTVLTQVLSILIERTEFKRHTGARTRTQSLCRDIADILADASELSSGLTAAGAAIASLVDCDGVSVVIDQQVLLLGGAASSQGLLELAQHMTDTHRDDLVVKSIQAELPDLPRPLTRDGEAAGLLAVQIASEVRITVVWLRDELVETIRWGGPPGKVIASGPNGPRLTPRGSFETWKQTVKGSSRQWTAADHDAARTLKTIFQDVALERLRETDRERMTLLATLGHDLRDPLQTINLAMQMMGRGLATSNDTARRVEGSTRRMQSLIAYILDVSRIRSGIGLGLITRPVSLDDLLKGLVEELRFSYPGMAVELDSDELGEAALDEDRFIQGLTNLLSNARQHGDASAPIRIIGRRRENECNIQICNRTRQRPGVVFNRLIDPFKGGPPNLNNRNGLGLGLYIANAIFRGHGARFEGHFDDHQACMGITLPGLTPPSAAPPANAAAAVVV
ncbi:GAF domain-containing protein [Robbsia sp. Bb-Pol-6]|uniref:histidine kinase n=1 Tax=Robbsia betulipollinis TaxID=2981849 RepID=A0ABT3ZH10_9BURK|nr:GAF domain-containing protein [Robbsia betulipollinis]MCY0385809.1 GAF domain-containing protein [Robbsia betulipollinis]